MNFSVKPLLKDRKKKYGDAWMYAGYVLGLLKDPYRNLLDTAPELSHNWVLMLSKLIRVLFTPYEKDHYKDIIGYATLCLNHVSKLERSSDDIPTKSSLPE